MIQVILIKKILVILILLLSINFIGFVIAEQVAKNHLLLNNKRIPYQVSITIHDIYSERIDYNSYVVYIDFSANNLTLTSAFEIINGKVVNSYRASE